jgi:hypothetical protein
MNNPIIALWTHPRSVSTAFERIMLERGDMKILHEPFSYLYYFKEKKAAAIAYQSNENSEQPRCYEEIKKNIIDVSNKTPVFFKDMCYHCYDDLINDDNFLKMMKNTFLIRDPAKSIPSHFKMNPDVTLDEIGYEKEYNLFQKVANLTGTSPTIIDSQDLIQNPHIIIKKYCESLNLPFIENSLNWEKGHKKEWDTWKYWHKSVSSSKKIEKIESIYQENIENNKKIRDYYNHHLPFYNKLFKSRKILEHL